MPNTAFLQKKLTVVAGPSVTWVTPFAGQCTASTASLVVVAASTKKVRNVTFADGSVRQVSPSISFNAWVVITGFRDGIVVQNDGSP